MRVVVTGFWSVRVLWAGAEALESLKPCRHSNLCGPIHPQIPDTESWEVGWNLVLNWIWKLVWCRPPPQTGHGEQFNLLRGTANSGFMFGVEYKHEVHQVSNISCFKKTNIWFINKITFLTKHLEFFKYILITWKFYVCMHAYIPTHTYMCVYIHIYISLNLFRFWFYCALFFHCSCET